MTDRPDGLDLAGHLQRLDADGFTVVEGAVSNELCDRVAGELADISSARGKLAESSWFEGKHTVLIRNLLAHSTAARALPGHPRILSVVQALLGAGCLLSSIASRSVHPGESAQVIHVDDLGIDLPRPHPPLECTAMLALTEFTSLNGGTRVIPGSHRRNRVPRLSERSPRDASGARSVEMAPGSVLIYDASLWHAAGANQTGSPRVGIGMSYCRGWIRAHENPYLGIPLDLIRTFDAELRSLCGYKMYRGVINHVDGVEPMEYLDRGRPL